MARSCGRTHSPRRRVAGPRKVSTNSLAGWSYMSAGVPTCSRRPWLMMARRSATSIASSWSWVTSTVVTWSVSCRSRSHWRSWRAHLRVEGAERLVEEQHLGLDGEGPGQGHALALAARELGRVALAQVREADQLEQLVHPGLDLGLGALADLEAEGDVAPHGQVAERRVVLEAEADAAAARRRRWSGPRPRSAPCPRRRCRGRR